MNLFKVVVTVFIVGLSIVDAKTPCQGCKDLVDGILKGLDTTKNKNFGGGDTAWEEKKNLKYKTSETRLVEILDSACAKDNFKCNELLSEREDDIEKWYKKLQDSQPLHDFLCVDTAAVCCPEGKFGEDCQACPQNDNGEICFGRGKCEGSGDKQGSGKCVCDEGYAGDKCSECGDRHFTSFSNDTYTLCSLCHQTCQTCTGSNATDCTTCRAGYREEHDQKTAAAAAAPAKEGEEAKEEEAPKEEEEKKMTCVDINECVEKSDLCQVGEYCANTEGSYKCEAPAAAPEAAAKEDGKQSGGNGDGRCSGGDGGSCGRGSPMQPRQQEDGDDDELSDDDIKRLLLAVVLCVIGTGAASGSIVWNLAFFGALLAAGAWWASDKTDVIARSLINRRRPEL